MAAPQLYFVRVTFDASGDREVVERLWEAFSSSGPHLAQPTGIHSDDGHVTVDFDAVPNDPVTGATSVEHGAPGAEVVAALEGFSHQHTLVVPLLRALLTLTAIREKAGLPPRRELRVDVLPAAPMAQEQLSSHLGGGGPPENPEFGSGS
jgi:hypothetical protein